MIEILIILLVLFIMLLFILIGILIFKKLKEKNTTEVTSNSEGEEKSKTAVFKSYTKDSIYNFMEFEKIEDSMIIQKNGRRFLMVIECQGVNYDLMSEMEKIAVEEGFQQFLNSLRHQIQIYVQSRTVNLTASIENYKRKVSEYRSKLDKMNMEYEQLKNNPKIPEETLKRYNYEVTKQRNLYEYGQDIIENTQKMNLNKNILSKKYYIIVPYYSEEDPESVLNKEDIRNMAFSELYTKSQSIIRALMGCEVSSRILNSTELINLLHVAYNRDESETIDMEKVIQSGCEEIYSTALDVFEKKMRAIDEIIAKEAEERAHDAYKTAKSNKQRMAENREQSIEDLIAEMAKEILDENAVYIGTEMAEESKKIIEESKENKGGKEANEKTTKTRARSSAK